MDKSVCIGIILLAACLSGCYTLCPDPGKKDNGANRQIELLKAIGAHERNVKQFAEKMESIAEADVKLRPGSGIIILKAARGHYITRVEIEKIRTFASDGTGIPRSEIAIKKQFGMRN